MDMLGLADHQELIYISSVRTLGVAWTTRRNRGIIRTGGEREREGERDRKILAVSVTR